MTRPAPSLRASAFPLVALVLAVFPAAIAHGDPKHTIEHEPIRPDPANDVSFGLRLDGDLPPAIETLSGMVGAPDPRAALPTEPATRSSDPVSLAGRNEGPQAGARFTPDLDTRRPDTLPYSEPFVPSTAPWKRLVAFDRVDADGNLRVLDPELHAMPVRGTVRTDGSEERFYGDLVVDLAPHDATRIPSVGPGARVIHARLGIGGQDLDFEMLHDSAENWFIRSTKANRARLVFELSIPRAVFGGPIDEGVDEANTVRTYLPSEVQNDADVVARAIGLPRQSRHETLLALVAYFRGFSESIDPPRPERSVYLSLALSKKGVCRHRAYAFMVTASGLGFRTRVVLNEAHAWVEVWTGTLWKRIDLGGAGSILVETTPLGGTRYAPPPDPFQWPAGSRRGDDLGRTASGSGRTDGAGSGTGSLSSEPSGSEDTRVASTVTLESTESSTPRGQPVHVRGTVFADGAPCAHLGVAISARDRKTEGIFTLGELATDEHGAYAGTVDVPRTVDVGEYELFAVTPGGLRCKKGTSQ